MDEVGGERIGEERDRFKEGLWIGSGVEKGFVFDRDLGE